MEKHIQLVTVLQIGLGIMGLLFAGVIFFFFIGMGFIADDPEGMTVLSIIGTAAAVMFGFTSIPSIVGGIGLLRRKAWSRIVLMIVSVFDLLNIPIGTAVGAYTLWVMMQDETVALLKD